MKMDGRIWLIALLALTAGCSGSEPEPEPDAQTPTVTQTEDVVTRAAEIARAVEADPDRAEEILEQHGVTVPEFEEMMYRISADPELSRVFEAALAE